MVPPGDCRAPTANPTGRRVSVTVGILTYQRPKAVVEALASLSEMTVEGSPELPARPWCVEEVLVIDNDRIPSAAEAVAASDQRRVPVRYVHEPEPGLAAARNRALDETSSDVLVFIDDDERAGDRWPDALVEMMTATGAALVGAPVRTHFTASPPPWVVASGFFDRDEPEHGSTVDWLRSGNLAIDVERVRAIDLRFDRRFGLTGGEDTAFSLTAARRGLTLRWSREGEVSEEVGPERTTIRWMTRRSRLTAAAYVRADLLDGPSLQGRSWVLARGCGRFVLGLAGVLGGLATLDSTRLYNGMIMTSKGVGLLQGLTNLSQSAYRINDDGHASGN